jgi:hypothetical protein
MDRAAQRGSIRQAVPCLLLDASKPISPPGYIPVVRPDLPPVLPQTCLKQFGIHLMFLVNPPYCPPALLHMLDGTLPGALASSPVLSFPRSAA